MSKNLNSKVAEAFDQWPEDDTMLVCQDGNIFRLSAINLAEEHCRRSRLDAPVKVTRGGKLVAPEAPPDDVVMSADDNAKLEGERIAKEKAEAEEAAKAKAEADAEEAAKAKAEAEPKPKKGKGKK
jgi:CRISPR/Cas system CMR subunit Cmr4 (Cas7 group RAMP superfamily)